MNNKQIDKDYFKQIYEETYLNLRRFVQRRSKNSAMVDDIMQEVYLEVFRHLDNLKTHENLVGWIYKTADNKTKKLNEVYIRYTLYETNIDDWQNQSQAVSQLEILELDEYKAILREDEYAFLMMKYQEGYSHKELAELTGNTVAGSKMKLSRIVGKLKNNIHIKIIFLVFHVTF